SASFIYRPRPPASPPPFPYTTLFRSQIAARAGDGDVSRRPVSAELRSHHEHQQQREDEDEEQVALVLKEAGQLHSGDRQGASHAIAPRSGTIRAIVRTTAANTSMMMTGPAMSATPPPPLVMPSPRIMAPTGFRSNSLPSRPVPLIGKKAPPAMP